MFRTLSASLSASLIASAAMAQSTAIGAINPPLSLRNANYTIQATLQPTTRTITGRELISWRNISTKTATELQFHLYWNAWRDNRSTWMREASLVVNRPSPREQDW